MTINELIEQGITIQGKVRVSGVEGVGLDNMREVVYFEDEAEWDWGALDEDECPWVEYDINYMWANRNGSLEIELEVPED